jgi:hypothetical protein
VRSSEIVVVPPWGKRDAGKHFMITEWPAARAEKWAVAALLAFNRGGGRFPIEMTAGMGMRGIVVLGLETFLRGQMKPEEVQPILDDLLDCVKIVRDKTARDKATGKPVATDIVSDDDIQEVQTRMWLRSEVLRVHTGFSVGDALSSLINLILTEQRASPDTKTSPI